MPKEISFFEQVYQVARLIPEGKVTTYGAIGSYLGAAKSARMVGWAMNDAHSKLPAIPAHRVVNRNGLLSGKAHFKSPTEMEELLEKEGIIVENDKIMNFNHHFWNPIQHLKL